MDLIEFSSLFCKALAKNNLPTPDEAGIAAFHGFTEYLLEVNAHTNLTAIRSIPDVIGKHLVDSLFAAETIPNGASVLDLGCGPGFPSIPLAIARPDLKVTALDSTAKKIAFVKDAAARLGLSNLSAYAGRAEDAALAKQLGHFDVVVSRAVARLQVLDELCLPYVKIGGFLLAMKGAKAEEELAEAQRGISILGGGRPERIACALLPANGEPEARALIKIPKIKQTPPSYPRSYAAILKKPL